MFYKLFLAALTLIYLNSFLPLIQEKAAAEDLYSEESSSLAPYSSQNMNKMIVSTEEDAPGLSEEQIRKLREKRQTLQNMEKLQKMEDYAAASMAVAVNLNPQGMQGQPSDQT
ncbi:MAG: hypothetical protein HY593_01970, partial [Candidatus Omnitrophica bacterium]|nr:hypothetical protein [Candidatus Omnitrophota bacterium]